MKNNNYEHRFLLWFAAFIVGAVMAYCFAVTFFPIPDKNRDLANFALGALVGSGFTVIVGFFFGSSKSNKDKDDTIANMASKRTDYNAGSTPSDIPTRENTILPGP